MQTEAIIKLIGHRPVYRVEPHSSTRIFGREYYESAARGAPVIEQEARNRFISGVEERDPAEQAF